MIRESTLLAALCAVTSLAGCRLPGIVPAGEPANVAARGDFAYAALAEAGVGVYALPSGPLADDAVTLLPLRVIAPPPGSDRIDDLAIDAASGHLFTLDALAPGAWCEWSTAAPEAPRLLRGPLAAPVGPFAGITAANGAVLVSGGTSVLTVWSALSTPSLSPLAAAPLQSLDLGRGQPDVLLAADGDLAVVSTHFRFWGDTFGITTLRRGDAAMRNAAAISSPFAVSGRLELRGAGYADGGARPANFPLVVALADTNAIVTAGRELVLLDLAQSAAPRESGRVELPFVAVHVAAHAARAVAVGGAPTPMAAFLERDASDRWRLVATRALPASSQPTGVAFAGEDAAADDAPPRVVIAARGAGLLVFCWPRQSSGS